MAWETVIGLEVHVQLRTASKIFSGASTAYGAPPNTQACAIDLALPGVLPVMNREAAAMAVKFGLAVGAAIHRDSVFARKNYFYPDLPKGYQISQYDRPIVSGGRLALSGAFGEKTIGLTRAHLEEDAGKSLHEDFHGMSGIDLNRAGTPLLEIVSEPDMRSAAEAVACLKTLHTLVRYLDISDGNMQEGSFRCDANVSVRRSGDEKLGVRTEIKNVNSFRFVEQAILYEAERQVQILEDGGAVAQETRLYDEKRNHTVAMRDKEEANDYRYFPDPDLPPLRLDEAFIEAVRATLPELPEARKRRLREQYGLSEEDARHLGDDRDTADYYENAVAAADGHARIAANWITGELASHLNKHEREIADSPVAAAALGTLVRRIGEGVISGNIAKRVFRLLWDGQGADVDAVIKQHGLQQITDEGAIERLLREVLEAHPEQVRQYREGNEKVLGYLVGQAMKASGGKANPGQVNKGLRALLEP